jgi:hypothetical protein
MRRFVTAALLASLVPASALAQQTPTPAAAPTTEPAPAAPATTTAAAAPAATPPAPAPAAPAAAPARAPNPWAGSQLNVQTSANGAFFDRSYVLSGDSTSAADMSITLSPRYRLNRVFQLRASWNFNMEFTNADNTTTRLEPRFSDPSLDLWATGLPPLGNLRFALAAGLVFPVSVESRANTLILTPRVIGQAAWSVEAFGGDFALIGRVAYSHPFQQYTTPGIRGSFPYNRSCVTASGDCSGQLRGSTNVHDQFTWSVILSQSWGDWSPGVFFQMIHQWAYDIPTATLGTGAQDSHYRQSTYFAGWLDYNPVGWLTVEAGYQMQRSVLDGDGTYGNPFYGQYQDWRVYLSANIVLDKFFEAIGGSGAGGGGVIRTQNTPRSPIIPFARF